MHSKRMLYVKRELWKRKSRTQQRAARRSSFAVSGLVRRSIPDLRSMSA